jgi:hypothetical protein
MLDQDFAVAQEDETNLLPGQRHFGEASEVQLIRLPLMVASGKSYRAGTVPRERGCLSSSSLPRML